MGPWMMGDYGWGWFMPILMIIFWGLVIWGIVALVRYVVSSSNKHTSSALDTLKMRYAQGEISKAEYEEKKKGLI
jgi:putative membrane protein